MAFILRRVAAAVVLIAVLPGLWDYLEAVFLHLELDGALGGGRDSDVYYLLREGIPVDVALMVGGLVLGIAVGEDPIAWLQGLWVPCLAVALPVAGAGMRVSAGATRTPRRRSTTPTSGCCRRWRW